MSSKELLNENTVRRFMKLASIQPLSNRFINENFPLEEQEEEEPVDLGAEEPLPDESDPVPGEEDELDLGDDFPGDEEPGAADMSLTEEEAQILIDLGKRLEEALGEEGGEEELGAVEPEEDFGAEEPADEDALAVADEEPEEPAPVAENLVNEVLKRVTKRIVRERLNR